MTSDHPLSDIDLPPCSEAADQCGTESGPSGIFNFNGLVTAGFLNANGAVASGVDYKFDDCSKTAFAYDKSKSVMISYDDAATFGELFIMPFKYYPPLNLLVFQLRRGSSSWRKG